MSQPWMCTGPIVTIETPWLRLIGEHWRDDQEHSLDYWRIERASSVIIVPLLRGQVLLPHPQFRPGVGRLTLDLPGGRLPADSLPLAAAPKILQRELGLEPNAIASLRLLNPAGWEVDSSVSSQLLYAVVATLDNEAQAVASLLYESVAFDATGIGELLARLSCLQCRAVLQEALIQCLPNT